MKYAVTFGSSLNTSNGVNTTAGGSSDAAYICTVRKKRDMPLYNYSIMGYGTYGSATLAWYISPDQGTTTIAMTDLTDTAITMTANKAFNGAMAAASGMTGPAAGTTAANPKSVSTHNELQIWAKVTASTSTTQVTAVVYDNN
jgi:hypothetical protein